MIIFLPLYLNISMLFSNIQNMYIIAFLLVIVVGLDPQNCSEDKREVFLVAFHPHLDAFWLDSDDDLKNINWKPAQFLYDMNQRNSKTILNSMIEALKVNPIRKYFVTEVVFFKDWYHYLVDEEKAVVRSMLAQGQLEIANGGWVQNDEAVCYMDDILDQYTIGHNFLSQQFGLNTKIGWSTDSFGHSHSQVAIQHLLGIEFQAIERVDERYIYSRKNGSLLQFYWSPVSDSNNHKYGGVATYVRHFLHEVNNLRQINPQQIALDFKQLHPNMKRLYKNNTFFRFLGNDFQEFITQQFQNLEAAFNLLNSEEECTTYKYGSPSEFVNLLKELQTLKENITTREFDFLPNFDQDHYWSGYYTTDPQLKKICKDYSRLINLFRKIYIKQINDKRTILSNATQLLKQADQLLAAMQHHDGITATSKHEIERQFKERIAAKSFQIIAAISQLKVVSHHNCSLYQGGNTCFINSVEQILYFSIFHEGTPRKEKIELIIPSIVTYDIEKDDKDEIFCHPRTGECRIVFEPELLSGENVFKLIKIEKPSALKSIQVKGQNYMNEQFGLSISGAQITYIYNRTKFIKISYVESANRISGTTTLTWDKYGNWKEKRQSRAPGIYIMSNTGEISQINFKIQSVFIIKGKFNTKIYFLCPKNEIVMTIKNSERNIIDLETTFTPENQQEKDYFIKVDSTVDSNGQFYHDSNGYLVIKRKVGVRPDYNWQFKEEDKINANTYPMCSFAYIQDEKHKLAVFTDRAQGVTLYNNSFLFNIDRLAGDDYKGVGEGYNYQVQNTFRHKIAVVQRSTFIEREWQRLHDEALLAYYSNINRESNATGVHFSHNKYLKYSVFSLNEFEFVLRLFNLADNKELDLPIYNDSSWSIPELNLHLSYKDIKESFANGLLLGERYRWVQDREQISVFNVGTKDTHLSIILFPLQVRSFRINFSSKISGGEQSKSYAISLKHEVKRPFGKRCF